MAKKGKKPKGSDRVDKRDELPRSAGHEEEEDFDKRIIRRRDKIRAAKRKHTSLVSQPQLNLHYPAELKDSKDAKIKRWFNAGCLHCYMYPCTGSPIMDKFKGKASKQQEDYYVNTYKVSGRGNTDPAILFVGEAPGYMEDKLGKVFVGESGKILQDAIRDSGITKSSKCSWYIDNVVCCRPNENKTPSFTEMIPCSAFLADKIKELNPSVIVPLGGSPLKILLNDKDARIGTYVGNIRDIELSMGTFKMFPMWHPAYILRNMNVYGDYVFYLKRLKDFLTGDASVDESFDIVISKTEKSVVKAEKVIQKMLIGTKKTAFDIETASVADVENDALNPFSSTSRIVSIAFTYGSDKAVTLYTYHPDIKDSVLNKNRKLAELILKSNIRKIAHNAKFDVLFILEKWGFEVNNLVEDTLLTHYSLVTEQQGTHGLKALATRYAGLSDYSDYVRDEDIFKRNLVFSMSKKKFGEYNAMDVIATDRISKSFREKSKDFMVSVSNPVAYKLMPKATIALTRMEHNGMFIDIDIARVIKNIFKRTRKIYKSKISSHHVIRRYKKLLPKLREKGVVGKTVKKFTIRSHPQLRVILFDKKFLGLPVIALTKKAKLPSTNNNVMTTLSARHDCDLCGLILNYRGVDKTYGTYLKPFYKMARANNGYIHGRFMLSTTVTGRLSSVSPNLQNIPNKSAGHVKRLVVSRYGDDGLILSIDYSQLELRVLAALSGDEKMMSAYKEGKDLHRLTMLSIYGISEEEYNSYDKDKQVLMRTVAKRVNFGVIYGITAGGIVNILEGEGIVIEEDEAELYIGRFFEAYPGVEEFIQNVKGKMYEDGVAVSAFGRVRRFAEALLASYLRKIAGYDSPHLYGTLSKSERQAANHVIQSTASDLTLCSLIAFDDWLIKQDVEKAKTFAVIHDAIDVDVKREYAVEVIQKLIHIMEHVPEYSNLIFTKKLGINWDFFNQVPIKADADIGVNWRDMVSLEGEITDINISKLLNKSLERQNEVDADLLEGNYYEG